MVYSILNPSPNGIGYRRGVQNIAVIIWLTLSELVNGPLHSLLFHVSLIIWSPINIGKSIPLFDFFLTFLTFGQNIFICILITYFLFHSKRKRGCWGIFAIHGERWQRIEFEYQTTKISKTFKIRGYFARQVYVIVTIESHKTHQWFCLWVKIGKNICSKIQGYNCTKIHVHIVMFG